jgi:Leucine-rich repeat (LRR) protein
MKKLLFILPLLFFGVAFAQTPAALVDSARAYNNTNIVTNASKAITATKVNTAINKTLDAVNGVRQFAEHQIKHVLVDTGLVANVINDSTVLIKIDSTVVTFGDTAEFGGTIATRANIFAFKDWDMDYDLDNIYNKNTGNVGIGTSTPTAKLHIAGNVKIVDGTQGAGKVLTSDADGNSAWAVQSSPVIYNQIIGEEKISDGNNILEFDSAYLKKTIAIYRNGLRLRNTDFNPVYTKAVSLNFTPTIGDIFIKDYKNIPDTAAVLISFNIDNNSTSFDIEGSDFFTARVDWGDGVINNYAGYTITVSHTYTTNGIHNASFKFNSFSTVTALLLNNQKVVYIDNLDLLTQLYSLGLSYNQLTHFNPRKPLSGSLTYLSLDHNNISNFNLSLPSINALQIINVGYNDLVKFHINGPTPRNTYVVDLSNNQLPVTEINSILTYFDSGTLLNTNAAFTLDQQTPSASPTGAGITSKNNLITYGCTVITD